MHATILYIEESGDKENIVGKNNQEQCRLIKCFLCTKYKKETSSVMWTKLTTDRLTEENWGNWAISLVWYSPDFWSTNVTST